MSLIKIITDLFKPKKAQKVLGLCLRQNSLIYCYRSSKGLVLKALQQPVPEAITSLNRKFQLHGACRMVLPAEHYKIIQVDKPQVPENEINSALKWQIKDLVPYTPENMVLDYFDGPTLAGGLEKINVVCTAKAELGELVKTLLDDGFEMDSIITPEFAFAHLVPVSENACLLVCQQPNDEVIILIIKDGKIHFHRQLRGYAQINNKQEQDLMMGDIDGLSLEIQRSTDYFERQLKQAPIRNIYLLVPTKAESFLAEKLNENTNVPVSLLAIPEECQRADAVAYSAFTGQVEEVVS